MEERSVQSGYNIEKATFLPFLSSISLVSRIWFEETRPFVFKSIYLVFGQVVDPSTEDDSLGHLKFRGRESNDNHSSKSRSFLRLEQLLDLIASNPTISAHITRIFLYCIGGSDSSLVDFNNSAKLLLVLSNEAQNLSAFRMVGAPRDDSEGNHGSWWVKELEDTARSSITNFIDRPSLNELILEDAMVPASLWINKSSLTTIRLFDFTIYADCEVKEQHATPEVLSLSSIHSHRSTFPLLSRIPAFFARVTNFVIIEAPDLVPDINRILPILQHTLTHFVCGINCTGEYDITGEGHVYFDLSPLAALQTLSFELISWLDDIEEAYPLVSDTVQTIPWTHLESLDVRFTQTRSRLDTEHHWDMGTYINHIDTLISDTLPQTHVLQTITIEAILAPCDRCEKMLSEFLSTPGHLAPRIRLRGYSCAHNSETRSNFIPSLSLVLTRSSEGPEDKSDGHSVG